MIPSYLCSRAGIAGCGRLAALVLTLTGRGSDQQLTAACDLLAELGVDPGKDLAALDREGLAAQASAPVFQVAALLRGEGQLWASQSDESLRAQGRASAQAAAAFAQLLLPQLTGLSEALSRPGVRMLDVGTGVAAMAVAYAERYPMLTVVGIDVLPRVLKLAAETVAASSAADRVVLREQNVAVLNEANTYALGWLPAPFIPKTALHPGATRVARSLAPGGWLILAHGKLSGTPLEVALTRFKTAAYGGTPLTDAEARSLLLEAGLQDVMTVPTPPGAPGITIGRRA